MDQDACPVPPARACLPAQPGFCGVTVEASQLESLLGQDEVHPAVVHAAIVSLINFFGPPADHAVASPATFDLWLAGEQPTSLAVSQDIFEHVIIPVSSDERWALAVVHPHQHWVQYYDAFGNSDDAELNGAVRLHSAASACPDCLQRAAQFVRELLRSTEQLSVASVVLTAPVERDEELLHDEEWRVTCMSVSLT